MADLSEDSTESELESQHDEDSSQENEEENDDSASSDDDEEEHVEESSSGSENEEEDNIEEQSQSDEEETLEIAEPTAHPQKTVKTTKKKTAPKEPKPSTSKAAYTSKSVASSRQKTSQKENKMRQVQGDTKALTTKQMIICAVSETKDRKGSSTAAIRKYLTDRFNVSTQRMHLVTKLLRTAGEQGWLVQASGTGASSGSHFKLPPDAKKTIQKEKKVVPDKTKDEKAKSKVKTATKRKVDKPAAEKEVPAKKKKAAGNTAEASKKKATAVPKKKAAKV